MGCHAFLQTFKSPYILVEYLEIASKALKSLLPFSTSSLCGAEFSPVTGTKMRLQSRLRISNTLQVSLFLITAKWDYLCTNVLSCFSHVQLFTTLWTVAHQAPLSMGFPKQEYWSGLPFPSPGDLPDPGIEPRFPALQADSLLSELQGKTGLFTNQMKRMALRNICTN